MAFLRAWADYPSFSLSLDMTTISYIMVDWSHQLLIFALSDLFLFDLPFEKNYHIDSHRMLNFVAASRRLTQDKHIYLLTTHRPPSPPFHSLFMSPMLIIAVVGDSHRSIFMLIVLLPRYVVTRHKRAPKILLSTQSYSKPIDNLFGWMHLCCYTMLGFDPKDR